MRMLTAQPKTIRKAIEATQEHMRTVQWDKRMPASERAEELVLATKRIHVMRGLLRDKEAAVV